MSYINRVNEVDNKTRNYRHISIGGTYMELSHELSVTKQTLVSHLKLSDLFMLCPQNPLTGNRGQ